MRSVARKLIEFSLSLLPITSLMRISNQTVLPIYYHRFHVTPPPYFRNTYLVKTPRQFESDLDFLLKHLKPLTLNDLIQVAKKQKTVKTPSFHLSFDDGHRELWDHAFPILKQHNVSATIFLTTEIIDNKTWHFEDEIGFLLHYLSTLSAVENQNCIANFQAKFSRSPESLRRLRVRPDCELDWLWNRFSLNSQQTLLSLTPYLTSSWISEMIQAGISFGGHGLTHTIFNALSDHEQLREAILSSDKVASSFSLDYRAFAFPYGEFCVSKSMMRKILSDGSIDLLFGTRGLIQDEFEPKVIQRVWGENHPRSLSRHLKKELAASALRYLRNGNKVQRTER